jgi:hypothetical protein
LPFNAAMKHPMVGRLQLRTVEVRNSVSKITAGLLLSVGFIVPMAAQPPRDEPQRYYDGERKDYHEWNAGEDRAWHRYWEEQHHAAIEWRRAKEEQRRAYWRWRHEHPDSVLWPHH